MNSFRAVALSAAIVMPGLVCAQDASPSTERDNAVLIASEVESLMTDLEARAQEFPEVLRQLAEGTARAEDAENAVAALIERLTEVTDTMEDGSRFDNAIDKYKMATTDLIAEAEASPNDLIKEMVPSLRETLSQLEQDDQDRNQTVVEARNVIDQLKKNKEAIVFFIKAGEVQRGAALIEQNVAEFDSIVSRARGVANSLIEAANQ
jgi:DNA repair exonuclease SbcCD ATPase subunit